MKTKLAGRLLKNVPLLFLTTLMFIGVNSVSYGDDDVVPYLGDRNVELLTTALNPMGVNAFGIHSFAELPDESQKNDNAEELLFLDEIQLNFGGIISLQGSDQTEKTFITKYKFCLKVDATADALKKTYIKVEIGSPKSGNPNATYLQTNLMGCAFGSFETSYNQYTPSRWLEKFLRVEVIAGELSGTVISRPIYINPWETGSLFGWDSLHGTPPQNPEKDKLATVHISNMNYSFVGHSQGGYKLNKYMDLVLTKSYLLELNPKIDFGHNFYGEKSYSPIYSGHFKLKMIVLAPTGSEIELTEENLDQFQVISGTEKEVEIVDGLLRTRVDLNVKFTDLPEMATRTVVMIRLTPLDNNTLGEAVVSGLFKGAALQSSTSLVNYKVKDSNESLMPNNILSFAQKVKLPEKELLSSPWKVSPEEAFVLLHNGAPGQSSVTTLTVDQLNSIFYIEDFSEQDINALFSKKNAWNFGKLCKAYFPQRVVQGIFTPRVEFPKEYADCKANPEKYMELQTLEHIEQIVKNPTLSHSSTDRLSVGTGFLANVGESEREYTSKRRSVGGGLNLKVGIPFLKLVSLSGGTSYDISHIKSKDKSVGSATNASFARARFLYIDELGLAFRASVKRCLLVSPKEYTPLSDFKQFMKRRLHICEKQAKVKDMEESWFYVGESAPQDTLLRDRWNREENQLTKIIRGKHNFEQFYNLMVDDTKTVFLRKIKTLQSPDDYFSQFYHSKKNNRPMLEDGGLPGVIEK